MTEAELEHLLAWLSADLAEAARHYQAVHKGLVGFFLRNRCASASAETLADLTIDRVATHLSNKDVKRQPQVLPFFLKFAQFVLLDHFRKQRIFVGELDEEISAAPNAHVPRKKELASQCFHQCLQEVPEDQRRLFLRYYRLDEQSQDRAALAAEFGLSLNALRLRMMRLRAMMGTCMEKCQADHET